MTGYKLTPEQEQRFDEWNWRSDSSLGKIKSSTDIRELKILLAQEIQRAVEAERTQILNEVRWLVEGMGTYRTAKNIETVNKHDLLQAIEKLKEKHE